ncbi:SH3 domain-containing protein [Micromonospora sp. NPDC006766]|uniref:SH3 domain-containing protein n=1 Tax=Micromonospora sp. NPDC006766 TaxID=3154778 RepID=UPI0033F96FFA
MNSRSRTEQRFPVGPVWRDANVRSGPSLGSPILQLLLPDERVSHEADAWVRGDEVVEGSIVSDIWLRLAPGHWCSAVNFHQPTIAGIPASAELAGGHERT